MSSCQIIADLSRLKPLLTPKEEKVHLNDYDVIMEAKACIGHFIEQVYNQKHPHSPLGYLIPVEFEKRTCLNFANLNGGSTIACLRK